MKIRKAVLSDALFLFRLRNSPSVRRVSFNTGKIQLRPHRQWFKERLSDENTSFFIGEQAGVRAGQIRFDANPKTNSAEVSISVASRFRGKGLGFSLLKAGCRRIFRNPKCKKLIAHIKKNNKASVQTFTKAGFKNRGMVSYNGHRCLEMVLWNS
jgi:RimJ/RimL family protein N-acetyltransferase